MEARCHIDLEAIAHNFKYFAERVSPAQVIPVIKANAYGHGALRLAGFLRDTFQPPLFAVATLEEAQELASSYPDLNILIFSRVFPQEYGDVPKGAVLTIGSVDDLESFRRSRRDSQKIHLNVNTGMNRLGITPDQTLDLLKKGDLNASILGIYSHFSSSDTSDQAAYHNQVNVFKDFAGEIRSLGFDGLLHLSNSAGALKRSPETYDAMRLGIGLYGYDTSSEKDYIHNLKPAMTVTAPLVRVDHIPAGTPVSYGERWSSSRATNIGTLRIGYADGYSRSLTNRGIVTLGDMHYPVIGTVTMDHIMIDLGEGHIEPGTDFTVLGGMSGPQTIQNTAEKLNTIPYEICCNISPRVRRVYPKEG